MGAPGTPLEASKKRLGGSLGRLGAVLGALEPMLEPSGNQKAPKMEPGTVPNRGPEAVRTNSVNSSNTIVFFNGFSCFLRTWGVIWGSRIGSKCVPNRIIDAEGVRKPLDRHLGRHQRALGGILAALGRILRAIRSPKGGGELQLPNNPTATACGEGGERINLSKVL